MFSNSTSTAELRRFDGAAALFAIVANDGEEAAMATVLLAIVCGLVLLAIIVRTVLVVAGDGRRRVRDREAYDTRRPTL